MSIHTVHTILEVIGIVSTASTALGLALPASGFQKVCSLIGADLKALFGGGS